MLKATVVAAAALALVLTTQGRPQPAYASITLTVDNFGDAHAAGGATTCTPGSCTLRAALEIADNRATLVPDLNTTVLIPGVHTITLTLGALQVGAVQNQVITINGNGSANSILNLGACTEGVTSTFCSVLVLDPTPVGNVTAHLSGFTLSGGNTAIGGGGLAGGSASSGTPDDTDLTDVTISGNTVTAGSPGGGIAYAQGNLNLVNSTISGNATSGSGGGLDYSGDQTLTIVNSTFTNNHATITGSAGGGAIHTLSTSGTYNIATSTFTGNTAPNATAGGGGGAIFSETGTLLHISSSTFLNNSAGANGAGGAIFNRLSNLTMNLNRLAGNTAHAGLGQGLFENAGTVDAANNWWGTNTPDTSDGFAGPATHPTRWYLLRLSAPATMRVSTSSPITADLGHDNSSPAGNTLGPLPNVTTIAVTWPPATLGTVTGADPLLNGSSQAHATFNAGGVPGMAHAFVVVDGYQVDAPIAVVVPPTMIKAFGAPSIPLNGNTTLTFTITNPNTASGLTGVGFSDSLPAGLVVATPNGLTGSCGTGTITATAASGSVSLSGGTLTAAPGAGSSCTFSVNVTGVAAGNQNNTSGNVTSTEGGTGNTASASTNVVAPPAIAKAFNPNLISLNGTTALQFTITNPAANTVALSGVGFTDTLPTGLTVANGASATCSGTLTTTAPTGITLTGATIATNSQCVFSVTVTGAAGGSYTNTTGSVTSTNGGTGNTASANLSVASPPTIQKQFLVSAQAINIPSTLSITISNPNVSQALTGVAMTDTLPAGLVVSTPSNAVSNCGAGTFTATPGSSTITLTGGTLAAGANCSLAASVTGTTAGAKSNTTGPVSAAESGPGGASNTATITITSITLSSNNNPATEGITPVTYTAQVQPTPPTGTVTFYDGLAPIAGCSGLTPSPAGMATCNAGIYPTAGNHSIHANYSLGNANSNVVNEVVNDATLTAVAGSNLTGTEAVAIAAGTVLATFTDANPNGAPADFTATVIWGDAGGPVPATVSAASGGGFQVSGGHTYADAGTYPITVNITDTKGGAMASAMLSATVADVPLQITCNQNLNATVGQQFSAQVASIVDPSNKEPLGEYTITIDWGDGTTSNATFTDPPGTLLVSGSHTYSAVGTFTITVTAREIDPAAAAAVSAAGSITVAPLPTTSAPDRPFPFGVLLAAIIGLALVAGLWLTSYRRRRRL